MSILLHRLDPHLKQHLSILIGHAKLVFTQITSENEPYTHYTQIDYNLRLYSPNQKKNKNEEKTFNNPFFMADKIDQINRKLS